MKIIFEDVPAELREVTIHSWADFVASGVPLEFVDSSQEQSFYASLGIVLASSQYVAAQCIRRPHALALLVSDGHLFHAASLAYYQATISELLIGVGSEIHLMEALRRYRNREMVRIAWRDIAGWASLEQTLADLTHLAEACIGETLEYLFQHACEMRGVPLNQEGEAQRLVVLGMGKLGAWELNFSSDIDLIFSYEDEGVLSDKKGMSYSEFYTRVARSLVKVLDSITADGFVFRVDTRLRPFGDSGPLVMNFDGMEQYYHGQAREWERYAMVKARVVAGDFAAGERLQAILTPFVYRRYLDFRAFGELRELKAKITQELRRKDRMDNVKLGPGGIREIEFIGQAFQLIRGGQEKRLRSRGILEVLNLLGELGHLPQELVTKLKSAYRFLRLVENRIQQYGDKQTHDLPTDERQRLSLSFALGFPDWHAFKSRLDEVRIEVHEIFGQVIESPQTLVESGREVDWIEADKELLSSALIEMGYTQTESLLAILADFRESHSIRRITSRGASELNRIMPLLLSAALQLDNALETVGRILKLLEAIAGRNVYFTLLAEHPMAVSQLVKLASASSWIVSHIARFPLLLDELLDPRSLYEPLSLGQLRGELDRCLERADVDDMEHLMTALRQFKQANVLRIAAADIMGFIPIMVVSDYLTWLAETLVGGVLKQAWRLTEERHGSPPGAKPGEIKGFGVVAYGKMGGLELSYSSDLDLVFLYGGMSDTTLTNGESPIPSAQFYTRVVRRMVTLFTTQLLAGTLYEIDLRLRPSGNSGLLVSSLEAYETYQMESAWTWEQQALVRARFVAGDPAVAEGFAAIRRRSLGRVREAEALREEVRQMRDKMRENLETKAPGIFDLKQARGGIADIEFIVQFGVLLGAHEYDSLLRWTDVVRLLDSLREIGFFTAEDAELLRRAYCLYRERTHRVALLEQPALVPEQEFSEVRSRVREIWLEKMECRNPHILSIS
ncbi:Bifunctional glutamine synthetase adenylyltransferase/adenylyl-removing enzyme [Methylococcales bacterium]|nr:Bifunctional glutamine synthetase adenylyltransferase/adenylyl-removing enzyme [Methylococcales bacterium]